MQRTILTAGLVMSLAACTQGTDPQAGQTGDAPAPRETMMPVEPDGGIGDGATPLPELLGDAGEAVPQALQGRWGLVEADCTSDRGDAKGLITVSGNSIRFYESTATVGEDPRISGDTIRAEWDFTGEGMSWSRDMQLALADEGDRLVRTEFGEDAIAEPLTYSKCQ